MKRILIALVATVMLATGLSAVTITPAQAEGIPGCDNAQQKWRRMATTWGETKRYVDPYLQEDFVVRLAATTYYTWCQVEDGGSKVKPRFTQFCHTFLDDSWGGPRFAGTSYNPYFWDGDGTTTNPPTTIVPDDNSTQNCEYEFIPASEQVWLGRADGGRACWRVTAWVRLADLPNEEVIFSTPGGCWGVNHAKNFWPWDDVILSPWHYA